MLQIIALVNHWKTTGNFLSFLADHLNKVNQHWLELDYVAPVARQRHNIDREVRFENTTKSSNNTATVHHDNRTTAADLIVCTTSTAAPPNIMNNNNRDGNTTQCNFQINFHLNPLADPCLSHKLTNNANHTMKNWIDKTNAASLTNNIKSNKDKHENNDKQSTLATDKIHSNDNDLWANEACNDVCKDA